MRKSLNQCWTYGTSSNPSAFRSEKLRNVLQTYLYGCNIIFKLEPTLNTQEKLKIFSISRKVQVLKLKVFCISRTFLDFQLEIQIGNEKKCGFQLFSMYQPYKYICWIVLNFSLLNQEWFQLVPVREVQNEFFLVFSHNSLLFYILNDFNDLMIKIKVSSFGVCLLINIMFLDFMPETPRSLENVHKKSLHLLSTCSPFACHLLIVRLLVTF